MRELIIEMAIYLGIAAILGLILGYLIWGMGLRGRLAAARAEGAAKVRTSVDGDVALRSQLDACMAERRRLEQRVDRLSARLSAHAAEIEEAPEAEPEDDDTVRLNLSGAAEPEDGPPDPLLAEAEQEPAAGGHRSIFARRAVTDDAEPENFADDMSDETAPEDAATEPPTMAFEASAENEEPEETVAEVAAEEIDADAPPPSSLLETRPDEVDDLKRIKGVGPVMEKVLNEKGVYLFHQVANFSASDIAWVNTAIDAFPGRIERDNWVGQAQDLYRSKYGRGHEED